MSQAVEEFQDHPEPEKYWCGSMVHSNHEVPDYQAQDEETGVENEEAGFMVFRDQACKIRRRSKHFPEPSKIFLYRMYPLNQYQQ